MPQSSIPEMLTSNFSQDFRYSILSLSCSCLYCISNQDTTTSFSVLCTSVHIHHHVLQCYTLWSTKSVTELKQKQ